MPTNWQREAWERESQLPLHAGRADSGRHTCRPQQTLPMPLECSRDSVSEAAPPCAGEEAAKAKRVSGSLSSPDAGTQGQR